MSYKPAKVLQVSLSSITDYAAWDYDDGTGDPWIYNSYQWRALITLSAGQVHSSHQTREPFTYNLLDINVGDLVTSADAGRMLKIVTIQDRTDGYTPFHAILEDYNRENTFQADDSIGQGNGLIPEGDGLIFAVDQGLPVIFPLPALPGQLTYAFISQLFSRFFKQDALFEMYVDQVAHGFSVGDLVGLAAGGYFKADSSTLANAKVLGIVTETAVPGPDRFRMRAIAPLVVTPMPVGDPGIPVYLGTDGSLTATAPANAVVVFVKIDDDSGFFIMGKSYGVPATGLLNATAAGAVPVDTDVSSWPDTNSAGFVVGTTGRVFMAYKNATDVYYVELTEI